MIAVNVNGRVEVWVDRELNRVMILADQLYTIYFTTEEADELANDMSDAARFLRRLREERG